MTPAEADKEVVGGGGVILAMSLGKRSWKLSWWTLLNAGNDLKKPPREN